MPTPAVNTFTSYHLNEKEAVISQQLSHLNVAFIQNLRSQIAEEKLALKFDPSTPLVFVQQEASLAGQLDILTYLLNCNEESQTQKSHNITTE